jgi:hypothetical protein
MIGPRGERDYVASILEDGMPLVGSDDIEDAGVFPETCAKNIVRKIEKEWLHPHVSVELEIVKQ